MKGGGASGGETGILPCKTSDPMFMRVKTQRAPVVSMLVSKWLLRQRVRIIGLDPHHTLGPWSQLISHAVGKVPLGVQ